MRIKKTSWTASGGVCLQVETDRGVIRMVEAGRGDYASRQTYPDLTPEAAYQIADAALDARQTFEGNTYLQRIGEHNFYFTRYGGNEIVVGKEE